jgi:hypothetical protein
MGKTAPEPKAIGIVDMADPKPRQVTILPNVGISGTIDLDKFVLISSRDIVSWIPKTYQSHVKAIASLFTTLDFDIENVGVIVRKQNWNRLAKLSADEVEQLNRMIDVLAFAAHNRRGFTSAVRDNFYLRTFTFDGGKPPQTYINLPNRRYNMRVTERTDHMLQLPDHIHYQEISSGAFDGTLLHALMRCVSSKGDEDRRLLLAISWINQSWTDSDSVSEYTRFLLIATAFEALLDTPDQGITSYFRNTVQFLLGASNELARWATAFYKQRSKIIHGQALPELWYGEDKHNSIVALADIVFYQCLIRKLGLMGYWPDNVAEYVHLEDIRKYLISNKKRFTAIRKFRLTADLEAAWTFRNYLHTIQRGDGSVSEEDCKATLLALVELALQGIRRLSGMAVFSAAKYRSQLAKHRTAFTNIRSRLHAGDDADVVREFMAVTPDPNDKWCDPRVRGRPFGTAGIVTLSGLIHATRQVNDRLLEARLR